MTMQDIIGISFAFWNEIKLFVVFLLAMFFLTLYIKSAILNSITNELEKANSYLYDISSTTSDLNRRLMEIERTLENIKDSKR
jgi:dipeptide/tripeptide permease